jgi:hypothetical protein
MQDIWKHPIGFWHWSAKWQWYTSLFFGAAALIALGEYAFGVALLALSALSLLSKLLHWAGLERHQHWTTILKWSGGLGIGILFVLFLFITFDIRGGSSWSHLSRPITNFIARREVTPPPAPTPKSPSPLPPKFWADKTPRPIPHRKLPPLTKQGAFSALIPFSTDPDRPGIPYNDNLQNPMLLSYTELAGIGYLPSRSPFGNEPPITDAQGLNFVSNLLRYYIIRSIDALQSDITLFSFETGKGLSATTASPVSVPEGEKYPAEKLNQLLKETKMSEGTIANEQHRWWGRYPLQVPSGTTISIIDDKTVSDRPRFYVVRLKRKGAFKLDFSVEPRPGGKGVLPMGFHPAGNLDLSKVNTYAFTVKMHFEWYGDYMYSEPYSTWAVSLFSGLEKKLKQAE